MADRAEDDIEKGAVDPGRGVVFIAAGKMYFMAAGAAIEFLLPRLVGKFAFGAYGFVVGSASILNNVIVTGTMQAVSRYTTADTSRANHIKATGIRMHLRLGLVVALIYAAVAPLWARLMHDAPKVGPLMLSSAVVAGYAFYSVFTGSANGTRQFHKQAGLDVTFSTMKAIGVLGAAALGLGLYGIIGGWVLAVVAILFIATKWVGRPRGATADPIRPMATFLGGLALYLLLLNLIMLVDQLLLKRLAAEWFAANGATVAEAAKGADGQVGLYRAVQNLARLPYQLMIAVTFVIFPLISRASFQDNLDQARVYIRTTLRYSLIIAGAMGTVLAANAGPMLDVPYTLEFAQAGAGALVPLALGNVAFAMFAISGAILNGAGHTKDTIAISALVLVGVATGLWIAIPRADPGYDMLLACGAVTGSGMLVAALGSGVLLYRRFGAFLPLSTALRVALAVAATFAVAQLLPTKSELVTLLEAVLCGVTFLMVLILTGELTNKDLGALLSVIKKKKAA